MQPKQCENCARSFLPKYRVTKQYWSTRRFCSPECSIEGRRNENRPTLGVPRVSLSDRFWSKVDRQNGDACWVWRGATDGRGYGYLAGTRGESAFKAHRLSFILHHGDIPDGLCVCHTCDNPPCVNPAHLWLGTRRENNADKVAKGRQPSHIGDNNPRARITWEQRDEIIALVASGRTQTEVAEIYRIPQTQVSRIVLGKSWVK